MHPHPGFVNFDYRIVCKCNCQNFRLSSMMSSDESVQNVPRAYLKIA